MNWIIIDKRNCKALYGANNMTLHFSSKENADEFARQIFLDHSNYMLVEVSHIPPSQGISFGSEPNKEDKSY